MVNLIDQGCLNKELLLNFQEAVIVLTYINKIRLPNKIAYTNQSINTLIEKYLTLQGTDHYLKLKKILMEIHDVHVLKLLNPFKTTYRFYNYRNVYYFCVAVCINYLGLIND